MVEALRPTIVPIDEGARLTHSGHEKMAGASLSRGAGQFGPIRLAHHLTGRDRCRIGWAADGWAYFASRLPGVDLSVLYARRSTATGRVERSRRPGSTVARLPDLAGGHWGAAALFDRDRRLAWISSACRRTGDPDAGCTLPSRPTVAPLLTPRTGFFTVDIARASVLDGSMTTPRRFDPSKRYPAIVYFTASRGADRCDRWGGTAGFSTAPRQRGYNRPSF